MATLTTAHLPATMTADPTPLPAQVKVLTCEHGPACPRCVLAAARVIVQRDATLVGEVYTD